MSRHCFLSASRWVLVLVTVTSSITLVAASEATLRALATAQFGEISLGFERLLASAAAGEVADFQSGVEEEDDPLSSLEWSIERTLEADQIVWLCTDPEASFLVSQRGILIKGARVEGMMRLYFARVSHPIYMESCAIPEGIDIRLASLYGLYLPGTYLGVLYGDGVIIETSLQLRERFVAEKCISLVGARIGGDLTCNGSLLRGRGEKPYALLADRAIVKGGVFLGEGFTALNTVRLLGAEIGDNLNCVGANIVAAEGDDEDETPIALNIALSVIDGQLLCSGATLVASNGVALAADGADLRGGVVMNRHFRAEGEIRLTQARLGYDLDCASATVINPQGRTIVLDGALVSGNVTFVDDFLSEGELRLVGATVHGELRCQGATLSNPGAVALYSDVLRALGDVHISGGTLIDGAARFAGAEISGRFSWTDIEAPERATLDLRGASAGELRDDQDSWPSSGNLWLHGFVYRAIADTSPLDDALRLDWIRRQPGTVFLAQPYEQLASVLREAGHERESTRVLIAKNRDMIRTGSLPFFSRCGHQLMGWILGYGYQPAKAFLWWFGAILLGAIVFRFGFHTGAIVLVREKEEPRAEDQQYTFSALALSFDTFVPLIRLPLVSSWRTDDSFAHRFSRVRALKLPLGRMLRWYLWVHTVAGWILTSLLIAGVAGLVRA